MNSLNDRFYMNFFGSFSKAEEAFDSWNYAEKIEKTDEYVKYAVDTTAFTDEPYDEDDYCMDAFEIYYYLLEPGQKPDPDMERLPRWNREMYHWDGSDETWEYCMIGSSSKEAEEVYEQFMPDIDVMFDNACVLRFFDYDSCVTYLKAAAMGYRGDHQDDRYAHENIAFQFKIGSPLSFKIMSLEDLGASDDSCMNAPEKNVSEQNISRQNVSEQNVSKQYKGEYVAFENIAVYAFGKSPEETHDIVKKAEHFCRGANIGSLVTSNDVPETFAAVFIPVYDEDVHIVNTLHHVQNNYNVEEGFVLEAYPAGIHIAEISGKYGIFDALGGNWIYPHEVDDIELMNEIDDGYLVVVQEGKKGLIRIMGDSKLHRIVAALLVECDYEKIENVDGEIICRKKINSYVYDKETDLLHKMQL